MAIGRRLPYPFLQASGYTRVGSLGEFRPVDLIVVHDMEAPELTKTAENVAQYFHTGAGGRKVSSHYCIDSDSVVQCVREDDVAWCAPGSNHNGIQLEHAGYARQSERDWQDVYSKAMLDLSAKLTAQICREYRIPVYFLNAAGLKAGRRGITTHAEVSRAFHRSDHTDPGPNFPIHDYVGAVGYYLGKRPNITAPQDRKPWPIPVPAWFWVWAEWHLQGRNGPRPGDAYPEEGDRRVVRIPEWAVRRLEALVAGRK